MSNARPFQEDNELPPPYEWRVEGTNVGSRMRVVKRCQPWYNQHCGGADPEEFEREMGKGHCERGCGPDWAAHIQGNRYLGPRSKAQNPTWGERAGSEYGSYPAGHEDDDGVSYFPSTMSYGTGGDDELSDHTHGTGFTQAFGEAANAPLQFSDQNPALPYVRPSSPFKPEDLSAPVRAAVAADTWTPFGRQSARTGRQPSQVTAGFLGYQSPSFRNTTPPPCYQARVRPLGGDPPLLPVEVPSGNFYDPITGRSAGGRYRNATTSELHHANRESPDLEVQANRVVYKGKKRQ